MDTIASRNKHISSGTTPVVFLLEAKIIGGSNFFFFSFLRGQEVVCRHAGKATERRGRAQAVRALWQHRRVHCVERA